MLVNEVPQAVYQEFDRGRRYPSFALDGDQFAPRGLLAPVLVDRGTTEPFTVARNLKRLCFAIASLVIVRSVHEGHDAAGEELSGHGVVVFFVDRAHGVFGGVGEQGNPPGARIEPKHRQ